MGALRGYEPLQRLRRADAEALSGRDARDRPPGARLKIAYQGVRGAYSEAALLKHFGADVEAVGFPFSEQVFDAVESGRVDGGFVPVENSIAGSVGVNTDLLLERKVFAVAESYLPIEHCLLGRLG